jgi:hypothetical protein
LQTTGEKHATVKFTITWCRADPDIRTSTFYDSTIGWNRLGDSSVIDVKINTPFAVVSWASGTQVSVVRRWFQI